MTVPADDPDPLAFLGMPEERRAVAANALELLGAQFGIGPDLRQQIGELLEHSSDSPEQTLFDLVYGMMDIASILVKVREVERNRTPAQTVEYLRRVLAPPSRE